MLRRRDLDDESFRRAATIVVSTRDQIENDEPIRLTEGLAAGAVTRDRIWEIGELVCGKAPRRQDGREITILKERIERAVRRRRPAVMQGAKERGLGRELPSYLFEAACRA